MEQPPKNETAEEEKPEPVTEEGVRRFSEFLREVAPENEFLNLRDKTIDELGVRFKKERLKSSLLYHKLAGSSVGEKPFEEVSLENEPEVDRAVVEVFRKNAETVERIKRLQEFRELLEKIDSELGSLVSHQKFTLVIVRMLEEKFSHQELTRSFLYHRLIRSIPQKETTLKSEPEIDEAVFKTAKKVAEQLEQEKSSNENSR